MLTVPATWAVTTSGDRVARRIVLAVASIGTVGTEMVAVARDVALVTGPTGSTLAHTGDGITCRVTSTSALLLTVLAEAAHRTGCQWQRILNITSSKQCWTITLSGTTQRIQNMTTAGWFLGPSSDKAGIILFLFFHSGPIKCIEYINAMQWKKMPTLTLSLQCKTVKKCQV